MDASPGEEVMKEEATAVQELRHEPGEHSEHTQAEEGRLARFQRGE